MSEKERAQEGARMLADDELEPLPVFEHSGYGDPLRGNWDTTPYSNLDVTEYRSFWESADRPAKALEDASWGDTLAGVADVIAGQLAPVKGGKREAAESPRVAELRAMSYRDYLRTPEWRATRQAKIAQAGLSCQRCGLRWGKLKVNARLPLQVHHMTYARLGQESPSDLAVLCRICHRQVHGADDPAEEEAIALAED